jgi:hypothetical protein
MLIPAVGSLVWWGLIPVGPPTGDKADKALWVFALHPLSSAFLSFLLVSLFLTSIDEENPWRPLNSYIHISATVFVAQVPLLSPIVS